MYLQGSITALTTPFTESGLLDLNAWRAQLDLQVNSGSSAVVVAGSTGEAAALSDEEYVQLIELASIRVSDRLPILAGTGQSSTAKTIKQTKMAKNAGANIALVVTPPYVRPTQAGLVEHYVAVAESSDIPVVLYNVPGRTGCDLLPETVAKLASHENIIGLKEAVGDEARWRELYPLATPNFSLLSGDDHTFARAMLGGAQGVISVASNAVPASFARICKFILENKRSEALKINEDLRNFYDFLGVESNPIPIKAIMQRLGFGTGLRLPLTSLTSLHHERAQQMTVLCKTMERSN